MQTPYIYVNYRKLLENIKNMANMANEANVDLRPHCKSHKTVEIARQQIRFGASGITASTLKEVEMLKKGGIKSITLAYPLISEEKINNYIKSGKNIDLRSIVLDYEHAKYLNKFFSRSNPLIAYLKVDCGLKRLGVQPEEIEDIIGQITELENIMIIGLLTHGGQSYSGLTPKELVAKVEAAAVLSHKLPSLLASAGSTPTAKELLKIPGIDEIRPGNYVFYDNTMINLGVCKEEECSLFIKSTILAIYKEYMVIDAGSKTLSSDSGVHGNTLLKGFGLVLEDRTLLIERLSEEHGIVTGSGIRNFKIGDELTIIPNHACSVVNLFDEMHIFDGNKIFDIYKVKGRGH
jgi:D-serine deaminase-like pyridoxal phosphate-dependent protein